MNKPVIFLGSNWVLDLQAEACDEAGLKIAGIIDNDYYGNTESLHGIPVIDSETAFDDPERLEYYRNNFVFFCATTWQPIQDPKDARNLSKRHHLLEVIERYNLPCCNIIDPRAKVSRSVELGSGIYIGEFVAVDPYAKINDHTSIYGLSHIGHHSQIGKNCVVQRKCGIAGNVTLEDNVFLSCNSTLAKTHSTIGTGAFIHENLYVKRNVLPEEIVSGIQGNLRRIYNTSITVDQ